MVAREAEKEDLPFMWDILYLAAGFDTSDVNPNIMRADSRFSRYLINWGLSGDIGIIVVNDFGERMSAAWVRDSRGEVKGFGYLNDETPELAIGTLKMYRRLGASKLALQELIDICRNHSSGISLNVGEDNIAAIRLYEKFGFSRLAPGKDNHSPGPDNFQMYLNLKNV